MSLESVRQFFADRVPEIDIIELSGSTVAAGAIHSAVRIAPEYIAQLTDAKWVDVCQPPAL